MVSMSEVHRQARHFLYEQKLDLVIPSNPDNRERNAALSRFDQAGFNTVLREATCG